MTSLGSLRAFSLAIALALAATASAQSPEARQLEERLAAPCCWTDSLAGHESPLATELRREIEHRLAAGERAEAIEADLASRYGERIRLVPSGLVSAPFYVGALALVSIALVALGAWYWRRRKKESSTTMAASDSAHDDSRDRELDSRIDAELDALDRS